MKIPQSFLNGSTILGVALSLAGIASIMPAGTLVRLLWFIAAGLYGLVALAAFMSKTDKV